MLRYTLKTLFRRRKELIVSIVALTLCVMLVTAAIGAVISIKKSISEYTDYNYGSFRAIQPSDSPEKAGLSIYGSIISEKSIFNGQLTVGYAASEALPIRLISGRLPEKAGEAAVEASLGQALMTDISIGKKLDISVMTAEGEAISVTLTVVGFTESTSRLSIKDGGRYLIPSVLVTEGSLKCFPEIYSVITDGNIGEDSLINPRFSDMVIVSVEESTQILLIVAAILTVIAAVISVFIFASATKPTVNRQLSELRLIGAGGKELASFILLRTLILCLIALIFGTAAGYGCLILFSELVLRHFLSFCTIHFSFIGCGLICAVIFILTSLIGLSAVPKIASRRPRETSCPVNTDDAKHISNDTDDTDNRPSAITYSIFGKWMRTIRNKHRAAEFGLVAAMSIAYLSVFAGTAFGITVRDEYSKSFSDDYSVRRFSEGYYTLFKIPEYPYYGISAETLNTLAKTGEAEYISYIKRLNSVIVAEKGQSRLTDFLGQDIEAQSKYSNTNYLDFLKKLGLDTTCAYYNITVIESDDRLFSMLEAEIGKSLLSSDGVGAVMICGDKTLCPYSIGDRIKLFQSLSGASGDVLGDDRKILDTTVTVTGITEIPITSYLRGKLGGDTPTLVVTKGFFDDLGLSLGASDVYIGLSDSKKHEMTEAVIASVMPSLPESCIISAAESEAQKNALLNTVSYSAAVVAVFLTAICISVFVSATRADLLSRRKSIGILRSIGLDERKLLGEQTAYTLRIFGKAALINMLTMLLLNLLPIRRDIKGLPPELLIAYVVSMLCALAATLPTVREMFKEKVADMTRGE